MNATVLDYSEIGEYAFGKIGRIIAQFSTYVTLFGVGIIFLILTGILMEGIVPQIGHGFWTLAYGIVLISPIAIILKTFNEIKIISVLGFLATLVVVIASSVLSLIFYFSSSYSEKVIKCKITHDIIRGQPLVIAFSVFTFAFGATAIFPNLYMHMKNKEHWPRSVISGYTIVTAMVLAIAICGYLAYGTYLEKTSTILDANQFFGSQSWPAQALAGIMILHIVSAFPVVINPVFLAIERNFEKKNFWNILSNISSSYNPYSNTSYHYCTWNIFSIFLGCYDINFLYFC